MEIFTTKIKDKKSYVFCAVQKMAYGTFIPPAIKDTSWRAQNYPWSEIDGDWVDYGSFPDYGEGIKHPSLERRLAMELPHWGDTVIFFVLNLPPMMWDWDAEEFRAKVGHYQHRVGLIQRC